MDRSLKGYQKRVVELERIKGWGSDVGIKIYYAILELAEAGQIWKHRENKDFDSKALVEELIDAFFYILEAAYHVDPNIDLDTMFDYKFDLNLRRNRVYPDDRRM